MKPVTAVFLGPSGIGKSDLAEAFSVVTITPDRVRRNPRDSKDIYYLSQRSFAGILSLLEGRSPAHSFGGELDIKIYPELALFKVRGEQQVLFRPKGEQGCRGRNLEVYRPVLRALIEKRGCLGWLDDLLAARLFVIILNPWTRPLVQIDPQVASDPTSADGKVLVELLDKRNENAESIQKRVTNIVDELGAWQFIASVTGGDVHVLEAIGWPYAEHTFPKSGPERALRIRQSRSAIASLAKYSLSTLDRSLFESLLKPCDVEECELLPPDEFREWTIYFACTLPGEPGCGCPDGDFLGEHQFRGTRHQAEAEAERISWETYAGDFRWWLSPTTIKGEL